MCLSIIIAALWAQSPDFPTPSAPAAVALSCIGALCLTALILLSHRHAMRSSALISIYLTISLLLSIAKSRSFLLRDHYHLRATGGLSILDTIITLGLFVLEELPKSYVGEEGKQDHACRDMTGGFWNRTTMTWLNSTLWAGFKGVLSMDSLSRLSGDFSSTQLSQRFEPYWQAGKCNKTYSSPTH